jgi:DNA-binding transcriptional regulator YbjK
MENKESIKDHIIHITTGLIEEYNGDTECITSRMIAQKAGIGLGLVNYHFGSKENLITECVQRIISSVVSQFRMDDDLENDKDRLTVCAIRVFDFLFEHSAISRVSILGDFYNYSENCNSIRTQYGLMNLFKEKAGDEDNTTKIFMLTAAMQVAFLGSKTIKKIQKFDLTKKKDRNAYITTLVDNLF